MSARSGLIIHADDFGETVEITRGICEAIEAGAVTSTTVMANMPGTADALPRIAALADKASFGVHLNFCEGEPLTRGATLVDAQGRFHRKRALFRRAITGRLAAAEVEAEITAQIARVHDYGIRLSHVDGHKHLHMLPGISAAVARVLPRFGIERVRVTRLRSFTAANGVALLLRQHLAWRAGREFERAGLRSPAHVFDIQAIMGSQDPVSKSPLRRSSQAVVEMFCHPGTALADIEKPGSCERHAELTFLTSPQFKELLNATGSRCTTYWGV